MIRYVGYKLDNYIFLILFGCCLSWLKDGALSDVLRMILLSFRRLERKQTRHPGHVERMYDAEKKYLTPFT